MDEMVLPHQEVIVMNELQDGFKGKTVLVTGGAGAIGGNLVRALDTWDTKKIIILDNLSSSYEWNIPRSPKIQFIHGDILNDEDPPILPHTRLYSILMGAPPAVGAPVFSSNHGTRLAGKAKGPCCPRPSINFLPPWRSHPLSASART